MFKFKQNKLICYIFKLTFVCWFNCCFHIYCFNYFTNIHI